MAKYLDLYENYKNLILTGMLSPGAKLSSVRRSARELSLSRTTVENAYALLAAEGYVTAKPQSGYFVSDLLIKNKSESEHSSNGILKQKKSFLYDMVTASADRESFDFNLWRRYIKSALRQDSRLLSYGDSRGESDLRAAIAKYVNSQRGVVCTAENIVVSAGTQGLLSILCVLLKEEKNIAFLGLDFPKGRVVFEDYGKSVFNLQEGFEENKLDECKASVIYVSPSHIDSKGSVLPMSERAKIVEYARKGNLLVIEDDYDSEFRYASHPALSLQGLDGGKNVVYIGTFSRLLLPSIRISFMVLPQRLCELYNERANLYNQTASKTEQIALCQYITDGHLLSRIKRQRKIFASKSELVCKRGNELLKGKALFTRCEADYLVKASALTIKSSESIAAVAGKAGVKVRPIESEPGAVILSCAGFDTLNTDDMLLRLAAAFE